MAVEKHALNKKERALMHVLLNLAEKNDEGVCLVKPLEIFEALPYDYAYTPEELEPMLKGLALDDYLEYISADNHGELTYCITMHQKGLSFARVERGKGFAASRNAQKHLRTKPVVQSLDKFFDCLFLIAVRSEFRF